MRPALGDQLVNHGEEERGERERAPFPVGGNGELEDPASANCAPQHEGHSVTGGDQNGRVLLEASEGLRALERDSRNRAGGKRKVEVHHLVFLVRNTLQGASRQLDGDLFRPFGLRGQDLHVRVGSHIRLVSGNTITTPRS
jgi:hypothetical protein